MTTESRQVFGSCSGNAKHLGVAPAGASPPVLAALILAAEREPSGIGKPEEQALTLHYLAMNLSPSLIAQLSGAPGFKS